MSLPFKLLPCPKTPTEFWALPLEESVPISRQNQTIAEFQFHEAREDRKLRAANDSNEDALAYFWKMRRDDLIDIVYARMHYSWRKRNIAALELLIMGIDIIELTGKDKVGE